MTERLPLFFLLASHLFVSGVLSTSILSIENKCKNTIWPVLYSWESEVSTTGFALKSGETRDINAPSSWYGLISARTLCSNSTGNFLCVTGDCESGQIECNDVSYSWSTVTYVYIKIDDGGTNTYKISLEYGYNLPITVSPSQSTSKTCMSSGCMVDLNKTCPDNLKKFSGGNLNACSSACQESGSSEDCCTGSFNSKQTCKPSQYVQNFERACPSAYTYAFGDNNITFTCSNTTDYVITFCPSSIPNITRNEKTNNSSSMAPLPEPKDNSQWKLIAILGGCSAAVVVIIGVIAVVMRAKNARKKSVFNDENSQMRSQSYISMISESIFGENPPMDGKVKPPNIQVFINFRGEQLRTNFVGHLVDALRRSEINVFIDNQEQRGEDLTKLFERIKKSGIAIAVFSSRYTQSKWCLEELVKIKERADQGRLKKVLPVFYKVTPENVKKLKGEFGDHFRDIELMFGSDKPKIKQWRDAIFSVSHRFGLTFDEKSSTLETDFIEAIVKAVLRILQDISTSESCKSSL